MSFKISIYIQLNKTYMTLFVKAEKWIFFCVHCPFKEYLSLFVVYGKISIARNFLYVEQQQRTANCKTEMQLNYSKDGSSAYTNTFNIIYLLKKMFPKSRIFHFIYSNDCFKYLISNLEKKR